MGTLYVVTFLSRVMFPLQPAVKPRLPTPSPQRAWCTACRGRVGTDSSPPAAARPPVVPRTSIRSGSGVAAATTWNTDTSKPPGTRVPAFPPHTTITVCVHSGGFVSFLQSAARTHIQAAPPRTQLRILVNN